MEGGIGLTFLGDLPVRRYAELAKLAEEKGLRSIWVADEPYFRGGVVTATACAMTTSSIRLGFGVLNPFVRHPAWATMEIAAIDELSGHRLIVGYGAGVPTRMIDLGLDFDKPVTAWREAVQIVREFIKGQPTRFEGKKFRLNNIKLDFDPPYKELPVYVGAMGPRAITVAGEIAEGLIISILCPPRYTKGALEKLGEGAAKVGKRVEDYDVVQYIAFEVSEDSKTAKDHMKQWMGFFILHLFPDTGLFGPVAQLSGYTMEEFQQLYKDVYNAIQGGGDPTKVIPDDFMNQFAIAGSPKECLEVMAEYKAAGATELAPLFSPWANPEEQVRLIGEKLVPAWKSL